jgi:hypothetical protein
LALVLGGAGVLALSGSQSWTPAIAASGPGRDDQPGSLTLVSPSDPSLPLPTPTTALPTVGALPTGTVAPSPNSNPYGLNSSSALTASGIPEAAQRAYLAAAAEMARIDPSCGLHWTVLAGIGRVESNHGRYGGSSINAAGLVTPPILGIRLDGTRPGTARISDSDGGRYDGDAAFDRAVGPMQFLPGTWKSYGAGANPQDINAAAMAAGRYLCAGSSSLATKEGRWAAIYRYNHSDSYVSLVLSLAESYANGQAAPFPNRPDGTTPPPATEPPATNPGPPPAVPVPPVSTPTTTPTAKPTGKPTAPATGKPTPSPTRSTTTAPAPAPPTVWPTEPSEPSEPTEPTATEPTEVPTTTEPIPAETQTETCPPGTEPTPEPTPTATPTCLTVEAFPTSTEESP